MSDNSINHAAKKLGMPIAKSKRRKAPKDLKRIIWKKWHGKKNTIVKCAWCPRQLTFADATVDHEPALSEGGSMFKAVIACRDCNKRRGEETRDRVTKKRKEVIEAIKAHTRDSNF